VLEQNIDYCPGCAKEVTGTETYCPECGEEVSNLGSESETSSGNSSQDDEEEVWNEHWSNSMRWGRRLFYC